MSSMTLDEVGLRVYTEAALISSLSHLKDLRIQQQLHSRTTAFQENRREHRVLC